MLPFEIIEIVNTFLSYTELKQLYVDSTYNWKKRVSIDEDLEHLVNLTHLECYYNLNFTNERRKRKSKKKKKRR